MLPPDVLVVASGPFSILADGNQILQPFRHRVVPVSRTMLPEDGRYVIHQNDHFYNIHVSVLAPLIFQEAP